MTKNNKHLQVIPQNKTFWFTTRYKIKKSFGGNLSFRGIDYDRKIAYFCSEKCLTPISNNIDNNGNNIDKSS